MMGVSATKRTPSRCMSRSRHLPSESTKSTSARSTTVGRPAVVDAAVSQHWRSSPVHGPHNRPSSLKRSSAALSWSVILSIRVDSSTRVAEIGDSKCQEDRPGGRPVTSCKCRYAGNGYAAWVVSNDCGGSAGAASGCCGMAFGLQAGQQAAQYHPWRSSGICRRFGQFPQMSQHPLTRSEIWQFGLMRLQQACQVPVEAWRPKKAGRP